MFFSFICPFTYQTILTSLDCTMSDLGKRCREDPYTGRQTTRADIRFEQACVLYNIGALHAQLGAMDNRQSPDVCT